MALLQQKSSLLILMRQLSARVTLCDWVPVRTAHRVGTAPQTFTERRRLHSTQRYVEDLVYAPARTCLIYAPPSR
jgi:hypothetical protein